MAFLTLPQGMRAATASKTLPLTAGCPLSEALASTLQANPVLCQQLLPAGSLAPGLYLFLNRRPLAWEGARQHLVAEGDDIVIVQPLSGG
jgi:hypothetical protein